MRRFLALAALMFGLASCQTEPEGLDVNLGGEVATTIKVSVADSETRSGLTGATGVFGTDILSDDATMRYVMCVYMADENENETDVKTYTLTQKRYVEYSDDNSVVYEVRLIPNRDYRFVVWADVVTAVGAGDNHYDTSLLTEVKVINTPEHPWNAMDESRDAFTGWKDVVDYNSASQIEIPLTRPFAKLRVKTNDLADVKQLGVTPAKATVRYTSNHRMAFNAFEGVALAAEENKETITHEITYAEGTLDADNTLLFADYFFANDDDVVHFTMDVKQSSGRTIKFNNFNTDIPVKRNHMTTISGNILTDGADVSVNVEETDGEINLNYQEELLRHLGIVGGELTLNESVTVTTPIVIKEGVTATIDLNGYNIINQTNSLDYGAGEAIIVYGNLTINGEGSVEGSTRAVWARGANGKAVVTINGGTYTGCKEGYTGGGNSVIYASSNNTVNITGGTFEALEADKTSYADKTNGVYAALNVQDNKGTINVYGGTFIKFNPAAPGTEPAAWNATHPNGFVVLGYKSALVEGSTTTYEVSEIPAVKTSDELLAAIAQGGYVKLGNDIEGIDVRLYIGTKEQPVEVCLDMSGKTLTSSADYVFYIREGSSLTIQGNGTVKTETPAPVIFCPVGNLIIENGTFIRLVPEGYNGSVTSMFSGTKPTGGWETTGVTINGGYFDSGYYSTGGQATEIEDLLAGNVELVESDDDIKRRGNSGDANKTRKALKNNCMVLLNRSNNYFHVYGGTFVGANPAWGDEGCMLPTKPNYLRPWSYYQGAFLVGQEFNENGIVLPEGFAITKGTHEDGRPTYTVTYNK